MIEPPAPLEWHPAYREWERTGLIHWINEHDNYQYRIHVPFPLRVNSWVNNPSEVDQWTELVLTKHKAYGWAPYVGKPFIYVWYVAIDQFNRWISGESWIEYLSD